MSSLARKSAVESWEDHVEAWHHLGREVDGAAWGRAAIAASLKGRYGESAVEKFAAEVGFSPSAVYQLARTFDAFPEKCTRLENLSFTHHWRAAVLTTNAEEARAAVALAGREGWSANALRAHLRPPAPLPAPSCETAGEVCGPVTNKDKTFHVAALVDSFNQSMSLFEAVESYDVHPLVQAGTKKSLKELSEKIDLVVEWLASLKETIGRRIK